MLTVGVLLALAAFSACGGEASSMSDVAEAGGEAGAGGASVENAGGAEASAGAANGPSVVEVCEERRGLVDFVWSEEDSRRLECNVEAVGDSIWGLSFKECVADAERCVAAGQANAAPPVWDCRSLSADEARISEAQRGNANALADQCFNDWKAIIDELKATASCETLVEHPLSAAGAAVEIAILVSSPGLLEPQSCRDFSAKYGGGGGHHDLD
jgi:hypothetical protein